MPGDYSRKTFDHQKHYSGVLMQQGRVQLDADWNEQVAIQQYRFETESLDTIGSCGVPKLENSFEVQFTPDGSDLMISSGRIYIDGILCELESTPISAKLDPLESHQIITPHLILDGRPLGVGQWLEVSFTDGQNEKILKIIDLDEETGRITFDEDIGVSPPDTDATIRRITTYLTQPHDPQLDYNYFNSSPPIGSPASPPQTSPPAETVDLQDGFYIVLLDAWQQEITALDDPFIQEVALGKADTTTRVKNIWQVKLLRLNTSVGGKIDCKTLKDAWEKETGTSTGLLNARTYLSNQQAGLCQLPSSTGYRRVENQLYRVEIHQAGDQSQAFFKWSRDNATVETRIKSINGRSIIVDEIGKDDVLRFASGHWVEIVDDIASLKLEPNPLFQIVESVNPATNEIILNNSANTYINKSNLKLRRWDQNGNTATETGVAITNDWIDLEDGIQVLFSEGSYHCGDYWLIPARTATGEIEWPPGEIPNENPIPQPPLGIYHHYCRLATLEVVNGVALREDCRELFPSLTEICAEDVCFDNSSCELPEAKTVQDALDMLCSVQDLRHHNKHLHGHGVVCGLKVKCGDTRNEIILERGYALDCEGFPINVRQEIPYNIVAESLQQGLLDKDGNGEVCLSIAGRTTQGAVISIEPHVPQDFWDSVFEGTLLKDFYEDCIESLIVFLATKFPTSLTDTPPVPVVQRRVTAFLNLLAQLINSASGLYGFLSVDEDTLLRDFYEDLKDIIASETFCAMFDGDRPFPPYDIDPGQETIFGPVFKFHHRLRLHPSRNLAYTCGSDNKIYVYDLSSRELIQTLAFPASKAVIVHDVAISAEKSMLYAVGIQEDKDSVFAMADIAANGTHTWGPTSIECGVKYVRLALGPPPTNQLYAIQKAQGLFEVQGIGQASFTTNLIHGFNATGILELSVSGPSVNVFAAEDSVTGAESTSFDQIIEFNPNSPATSLKTYPVKGNDSENDITIHNSFLYVTGTGDLAAGHVKTLYGFDLASPATAPVTVDLLDDTITRLAVAPISATNDFLMVTLADRFKVVRVDLTNYTLDSNFRMPVQIFPMDISVSLDGQMSYVLNPIVNTLTAIDIPLVVDPTNPALNFTAEPPTVISSYRQGVIDAFKDLMSHFLQYLKDCFCDKFLIDCPKCGPEDKVYLGKVEIQNGKVYNICNFTNRHYVKSFPTWSYWLSTIPILPSIKQSFAKFCCKILESDASGAGGTGGAGGY